MKSDKMEIGIEPKESDAKNSTNLQGGTSLAVKQELLKETETEENAVDQTSVKIDEVKAEVTASVDTVLNSSASNMEISGDVDLSVGSTPSQVPAESKTSKENQPSKMVDEQREGELPSDPNERTEPLVDEVSRTSTPSVPEISCKNESVLASVDMSEEKTEVEIIETAITKETEKKESEVETNESKCASEEQEIGMEKEIMSETQKDQTVEKNESDSQESATETQSASENQTLDLKKISENVVTTDASELSSHTQTSIPSSEQMPSPGAQTLSNISSSESISEISQEDTAEIQKTSTSTIPTEPNTTESTKPTSVGQKSQSNNNSDQSPSAAEEMDTSEKVDVANVSLESSDRTLDATLTPGSANRSRSESTDSAPETEITEAMQGAQDATESRRITRLSLQQSKTPDASRAPGLTFMQTSNPLLPKLSSPPPTSNLFLPSSSAGSSLGDESVMSLMATVIDKVMHGQPLTNLVVELQPQPSQQQNQVGEVYFVCVCLMCLSVLGCGWWGICISIVIFIFKDAHRICTRQTWTQQRTSWVK